METGKLIRTPVSSGNTNRAGIAAIRDSQSAVNSLVSLGIYDDSMVALLGGKSGLAVGSVRNKPSSVQVVVLRADAAPLLGKGFSVKENNRSVSLEPVDIADPGFLSPGDTVQTLRFNVNTQEDRWIGFVAKVTDRGIIIAPENEQGGPSPMVTGIM
ncbi:hypothetical protein [Aliamphritea spongicola]|nr:hypothetical protein [Aliamphritea spongicola]